MSATRTVHATDGTLLIDLGPHLTVEQLLEAGDDLNDYILEAPYSLGYRVDPNRIPVKDSTTGVALAL